MKIGLSGSRGFLGSHLQPALRGAGHEVVPLLHLPGMSQLDLSVLPGCEAVIHLSGENLADGRWTRDKKERIYHSRIETTRQLGMAISHQKERPRVLLCASAVGYYGDRGDEVLTEASSVGKGFLAGLVSDWEAACRPARDAEVRVVNMRFGVILSPEGGALAKVLPIFKWGLGGPIGSGRQWMSWVALPDVISAIQFLLATEPLAGPVNVMSPNPIRNVDFAHAVGHALHRPSFVPTPAIALQLALGEMAKETVLASQRGVPQKLTSGHFQFQFPTIDSIWTMTM